MLAARTDDGSPVSPTMKVAAEAVDSSKAQGVDVIDFGAGEPDFPTPPHIKAAAHAAIDAQLHEVHAELRAPTSCKRAICDALPRRLRRRVHRRPRSSSPPAASRRCTTPRWRCSAPATR